MRALIELLLCERGATSAEYALMLAIVGSAVVIASLALGSSIATSMNDAADDIETCGGLC